MTELPRRTYPLVVPPPGGFEDAVRRGRGRRRKQTGGSSALALVLVGALAYSVVGHGGAGGAHLGPAQQPRVDRTQPVASGDAQSPSAAPSATATQAPGGPSTPSADPGHGPAVPPSIPPVAATQTPGPSRQPRGGSTDRPYAARAPITHGNPSTASETSCVPAQADNWCTTARATAQNGGVTYLLEVAVCHSAVTNPSELHFATNREADFRVVDDAHNDTVWTHSKGQPTFAQRHTVSFNSGDCIVWQTVWDGNDDYGDTPPMGQYTLHASMTADESLPEALATFQYS